MLLSKELEVLGLYLGDYKREVYGRGVVKELKLSQRTIAQMFRSLENVGILRSRKKGSMVFYKLNPDFTEIKDILFMVEMQRKFIFLKKHRKVAHVFKDDSRVVGIYGSYAKGKEKKSSDLDVFIVGSKGDKYVSLGKTYGLKLDVKYFTKRQFKQLLRKKNPLVMEILSNHVLINGVEQFVSSVWREVNGFS